MSLAFYKWLHLAGIALVLMSLAAMAWRAESRKLPSITHGIGLLVAFVAGFGLLAKGGYGWPAWVWIKLVVWLVLGGVSVLFKRKPELGTPLWWGVFVLFVLAGYLGIYKPF